VTTATALRQHHHLMPFVAVAVGIASFSAMDGLMKSASLAIGAFSAMLWRSGLSAVVMAPVWKLSGGRWPRGKVMRLHMVRGLNSAGMATAFFWGLKFLPLAEGMAISFIAPLIALYLAAVLLGETIGKRSVLASILGLAGVLVIVAGKFGRSGYDPQAAWGIGAILLSAVLYAWNLILQRQQAQVANPTEIALFQAVYTALFLAVLAPWLLEVPTPRVWIELGASAALATFSLMVIAWGYAREEASVLLPLEYSAFIWAALLGWVMFGEALTVPMVAGAVLIVTGCLIATYKVHTEQTAL
jgi:S-adenosylmethionine uptake transporter